MTTCCSSQCEKRYDCNRHCYNSVSVSPSENYYNATEECSSVIDGAVFRHRYLCGELGDYAMFEPIEEEIEEKIPFPCQFLIEFINGRMKWDDMIEHTTNEVDRLSNEYAEKHNLKT